MWTGRRAVKTEIVDSRRGFRPIFVGGGGGGVLDSGDTDTSKHSHGRSKKSSVASKRIYCEEILLYMSSISHSL